MRTDKKKLKANLSLIEAYEIPREPGNLQARVRVASVVVLVVEAATYGRAEKKRRKRFSLP